MSGTYTTDEKVEFALKTALFRTMQSKDQPTSLETSAPPRIFPNNIMKVNLIEKGEGDIDEDGYYVGRADSASAYLNDNNLVNLEKAELVISNYRIIDPSNNVITSKRVSDLTTVNLSQTSITAINALPTTGQTYPKKNWFFRGHYGSASGTTAFNNASSSYDGLQLAWDKSTVGATPTEADIVPHLKFYLQVQTKYTNVAHGDNISYGHDLMKGLIGLDQGFTTTLKVNRGEGGSCTTLGDTGKAAGNFWFTQATSGTLSFYGVGGAHGSLVNASDSLSNLSSTKFPMISYIRYVGETGFGAGTGGGSGSGSGYKNTGAHPSTITNGYNWGGSTWYDDGTISWIANAGGTAGGMAPPGGWDANTTYILTVTSKTTGGSYTLGGTSFNPGTSYATQTKEFTGSLGEMRNNWASSNEITFKKWDVSIKNKNMFNVHQLGGVGINDDRVYDEDFGHLYIDTTDFPTLRRGGKDYTSSSVLTVGGSIILSAINGTNSQTTSNIYFNAPNNKFQTGLIWRREVPGALTYISGAILFDSELQNYSTTTTTGYSAGGLSFYTSDFNSSGWSSSSAKRRMVIHGNGNVGIGTTSPNAKLDVNGNIYANGLIYLSDYIQHIGDSNTKIGFPSNDNIYFYCADVVQMRINNNGVGIHTDAPANSSTRLQVGGNVYVSGNVGIGETSPACGLQVGAESEASLKSSVKMARYIGFGYREYFPSGAYSGLSCDNHATFCIGLNTHININNEIRVTNTHSTNAGTAICMPGNAQPNQGGMYFFTKNPTSVTAGNVAYDLDTTTPSMIINGSGNVGIGTRSPDTPLEIKYASSAVYGNLKLIHNNESEYLQLGYGGISTGTTHELRLGVNSSIKMTILNSGNVGIGETSPGAPLHINFTQSGDPTNNIKDMIKLETQYSTDFGGSYREGGSSILFYVENTTNQGLPGEAARIVAGCYESSSNTEYHSYLAFHTSNNGSSTGTNERMVIDDNGYVGIGETVPLYTLDLNGNQRTRGYSLVENSDNSYTRYGPNSSWGYHLYVGSGPHFNTSHACIFNTTTNLHIEPGNGGILYLGYYNDDETRIGSTWYSSFFGDGCALCVQGKNDGGGSRGIYYWAVVDKSWGTNMVNDGTGMDGSAMSDSGTAAGYTDWRIVMRGGDAATNAFTWENANEDQLMSLRMSDGVMKVASTVQVGTAIGAGNIRTAGWNGIHKMPGTGGSGTWLLIRGEKGQLPGYGNSWYLVHKTDGSNMYFSAGNVYSGYVSGGTYHMNNYWTEHFTGQHRPLPYDEDMLKNLDDYIGLIVSATNEICSLIQDPKDGIYKMTSGMKGIHVSEAIPKVILSTEHKDKKCYGIVAGGEDENNFNSDTRATTNKNEKHYGGGSFTSIMLCQEEDNRLYVNSVGEGGIWVSDEFGPIESGDYITTSGVLHGYGVLQDDDILHNYTVAKATIDCDFTISYKGMKKKVRVKRGTWADSGGLETRQELVNCCPSSEYKCYHMVDAICDGEEGCDGKNLAEDQGENDKKPRAAYKCKCSHKSDYNENSGWCLNEDGLICDISYCVTNGVGEHCEIDGMSECDISGNCKELVNNVELPHICCGVPVYKKEQVKIDGQDKTWKDNEVALDSSGEIIYEECCNCCGKYGWRCTCDDGYGCDKEDMSEYSCCVKDCCCEPDYEENALYKCREIEKDGKIYRIAFIACTYHCG